MTTLTFEEKENIIKEGMNEVMSDHLCGNYFDMSYLSDEVNFGDIEWGIYYHNNGNFRMVAYTEYGEYSRPYDFDFTFDSNLQELHDGLAEYLIEGWANR